MVGGRERERGSSQSADSGDARKADCLFVGSFWCCAHKQVETNNILAALRERVGEGGRLRLPQGGGNEANECREPLPSLMPASGPRVPLSLPSPPLASFLFHPYRFRCLRLDTNRGSYRDPLSYFEEGKRGRRSRVSIAFFNRLETGTGN